MKDLKEIAEKEVKVVLLTTGEEIVGAVSDTANNRGIYIRKPCKFHPVSETQMAAMSMIVLGDFDECIIDRRHIITIVKPRAEVVDMWMKRVGIRADIIQPKGGIVVP